MRSRAAEPSQGDRHHGDALIMVDASSTTHPEATPLHTAIVCRQPLRIYASPRSEPDHPWASFEDLASLAEWDEDAQEERWSEIRHQLPEMAHETLDGTRLIAQPMVGGLFMAWLRMGCEPAQELLDEWEEAWTEVFAAQFAHLPRPEWLAVMRAANLQNVPICRTFRWCRA